ncbi:DUF305 domain-containing protein [Opitutaceae bacterium EW11]|nr:DUF305 domain-containing protein [Opitutaceae bacterium EW11]
MKTAQDIHSLRKALRLATVLAAASVGATFAFAQGTTSSTGSSASGTTGTTPSETRSGTLGREGNNTMSGADKLSRGDRHFVEKAAMGGEKEVRLARLASERATDPRVRSFAETLIKDHEQANSELTSLASSKGITLANEDKEDRHYKRLSDKSGTDFDKDYVSHMVKDHEEDVEMFEKESRKAEDAQLAAFASKTLPVLQKHLQMAKDLETSLKR